MDELGTEDIVLRPFIPDDKAFVTQSWMRSYWDGAIARDHRIAPPTYNLYQRRIIDDIVARPNAVGVIAHPQGDVDVIIGWIIFEVDDPLRVVHYIYVKEAFRRLGIAKRILSATVNDFSYTHLTERARKIMDGRRNYNYNPWLLMKGCNDESQFSRTRSFAGHVS